MRTTFTLATFVGLVTLGVVACEEPLPPLPPVSGVWDAYLESPTGYDAAAVISIRTADVDEVVAAPGIVLFSRRSSGDRMFLVFIRSTPGPLTFQIRVSDTTTVLDPVLHQVATETNQLKSSLAGYAVEVNR